MKIGQQWILCTPGVVPVELVEIFTVTSPETVLPVPGATKQMVTVYKAEGGVLSVPQVASGTEVAAGFCDSPVEAEAIITG